MTENNTIICINEDIYNKFYNTLLVEIKKVIKRFQWRKALRKYKENNLDKVHEIKRRYTIVVGKRRAGALDHLQ